MKKLLSIIVFMFVALAVNAQTYKFYQTDNCHNQLRLNTKTGEVYQIQDDGQKFLINDAVTPSNTIENRYLLYKTQNMWL